MLKTKMRNRNTALGAVWGEQKVTIFSPIGLALISYAFFVMTTLIPPATYEAIMFEPDRIFLNLRAHLFVLCCIFSFVSGVFLLRSMSLRGGISGAQKGALDRYAIIIPLIVGVALNLVSVLIILQNNPGQMIAWLISAKTAKENLDPSNAFLHALPLLFGVCWWGLWRLLEWEKQIGRRDCLVRAILGVGFLLAVFSAAIKVARYDLMPGIFGFFLIYLISKYGRAHLPLRKYAIKLAWTFFLLMGIFVLFSWLRGFTTVIELLQNVGGYTFASYNRLAAILDGDLRYPYAGSGIYGFHFLTHIPLLDRWIDVGSLLGMPSPRYVWLSEFSAVSAAGLDRRYIWGSAFGYVYSDLGWFVIPYFFLLGVLSATLWSKIIRGRVVGIIVYPWFAFSILFWLGSNFVAYSQLITLSGAALLLVFYEHIARRIFRNIGSRKGFW